MKGVNSKKCAEQLKHKSNTEQMQRLTIWEVITKLYIAFARGGAHLPIAHALRLLSTKELRFGLTKLNLRKK